MGLGFRFGVWGFGFGVSGLGFRVWGFGFGVWGLGFSVWGLGFKVPMAFPDPQPEVLLARAPRAGTASSTSRFEMIVDNAKEGATHAAVTLIAMRAAGATPQRGLETTPRSCALPELGGLPGWHPSGGPALCCINISFLTTKPQAASSKACGGFGFGACRAVVVQKLILLEGQKAP